MPALSRRVQALRNLFRALADAPIEMIEALMTIRTADELIEEARNRFAELDRKLAKLQHVRPNAASTKQVREERDRAKMELLELIELAEMPVEFMGWA